MDEVRLTLIERGTISEKCDAIYELTSEVRRLTARVAELETLLECVPAGSLPADYVRWFG